MIIENVKSDDFVSTTDELQIKRERKKSHSNSQHSPPSRRWPSGVVSNAVDESNRPLALVTNVADISSIVQMLDPR